jgi:hypothetical protein
VCGSLAKGRDRQMRSGETCDCDDGWTGINCNVCTEDKACNSMVQTGTGGVCYQNGEVVVQNHQICKVTNRKITDLLGEQHPEVTFTCQKDERTCDFQCMSGIRLPVNVPPSETNPGCCSLGRRHRILLLSFD